MSLFRGIGDSSGSYAYNDPREIRRRTTTMPSTFNPYGNSGMPQLSDEERAQFRYRQLPPNTNDQASMTLPGSNLPPILNPNAMGPFRQGRMRYVDANQSMGGSGKQPYTMWGTLGDVGKTLFGEGNNIAGNVLDTLGAGYSLYRNWDLHPEKKKNLQLANEAVRGQIDLLAQNKQFAAAENTANRERQARQSEFLGT